MNPINVEPSGSLDFSKLNSDRTILDISLTPNLTNVYTLNMYYVGYQTFLFDRGFMSGVGMSTDRYIPEMPESLIPRSPKIPPWYGRPKPSGVEGYSLS